ncbi:hypothetical protein OKW45_001590 [Paraburkholderia sp. WSM4175]
MPLTRQVRQVERLFRQPGALALHVVANIWRKGIFPGRTDILPGMVDCRRKVSQHGRDLVIEPRTCPAAGTVLPGPCGLAAMNDVEAIAAWLGLHESAHMVRAYRREAERLVLWAVVERRLPLSSLTAGDATATGLRAHEFVAATLGDIEVETRGTWWMEVTGKGAKPGRVALPPLARDALRRYLRSRSLPVNRNRWTPATPLIGALDRNRETGRRGGHGASGNTGISVTRLRQVVGELFQEAGNMSWRAIRRSPQSCGTPVPPGFVTRMPRTRSTPGSNL